VANERLAAAQLIHQLTISVTDARNLLLWRHHHKASAVNDACSYNELTLSLQGPSDVIQNPGLPTSQLQQGIRYCMPYSIVGQGQAMLKNRHA
jgi:hypothetical protein